MAILDNDFLKTLEYLDVIARKRYRGLLRGERQGSRRGSSAEFLDHRAYTPGDDMRHLDWHVYHRFNELVLKLYREEQNLEISVLLDTSASMNLEGTRKREYALKIAAAVAYIGMSNLDRSQVMPFSSTLSETRFAGSHKGRAQQLFDFLEAISFEGETALARAASQFSARVTQRGVVVLISDFYDTAGVTRALRVLRGRRNDVAIVHLSDESEVEPPLRGEVKLVDAETGEVRELTVTDRMRERYTQAFNDNRRRVAELARRSEMGFTSANTSMEVVELLTQLIVGGGVVA